MRKPNASKTKQLIRPVQHSDKTEIQELQNLAYKSSRNQNSVNFSFRTPSEIKESINNQIQIKKEQELKLIYNNTIQFSFLNRLDSFFFLTLCFSYGSFCYNNLKLLRNSQQWPIWDLIIIVFTITFSVG